MNNCISCGKEIEEDRQVCTDCERLAIEDAKSAYRKGFRTAILNVIYQYQIQLMENEINNDNAMELLRNAIDVAELIGGYNG